MGLFSAITGSKPLQHRMQLYHYDNGDLEFIKRPIIGGAPTEIDDAGNPRSSWIDYFQELYPFDGYKNIPADAVQLAYSRHFHMAIHNILAKEDQPPDKSELDSPFISAIAEARAVELNKTAKPHSSYDKLILFLGSAVVLEIIIWGIAYALSR